MPHKVECSKFNFFPTRFIPWKGKRLNMAKRIKEDCYTKTVKTIKKYNLIENGDKIVVGVSGGPDSMCLLDILIKVCQNSPSPLAIIVAHINHMIRDEADEEENFVKNFCQKNNVKFYSKRIDVKKIANTNKIGIEEAGRNERYTFFEEVLIKEKANKIAIAHNKNDKAETVIMNILRGTGISGLKGIEVKNGKYIRPLIECERHEIEDYCIKENLNPKIDKSNFNNIYTRNKVRNIVIPYIKDEFNPNIIETIRRLSELVTEEEEYIEKQVKNAYISVLLDEKENEIILDLKKFNLQEKVIKSKIIIYTITRLFGSSKGVEKVHIEDILKLCSNNIGNKYLTPNKNVKISIKNHKIYILKL